MLYLYLYKGVTLGRRLWFSGGGRMAGGWMVGVGEQDNLDRLDSLDFLDSIELLEGLGGAR